MDSAANKNPWLCHICDTKGSGESLTCSHCYKVACARHIKHVPCYNSETGLYQLMPICLDCAIEETLK